MESKLFDKNGYLKEGLRNRLLGNNLSSNTIDELINMTQGRVELMALEHILVWEIRDKVLDRLMDLCD